MFLGLLKQNLIFKHKEITQLNIQNKLQHVSRFAIGISSLWKQEHCYINQGVEGQELLARWIGRGGPIAWLPRSPDITPLDFFLWSYVKDVVYRTKVKDISDLKERITAAVEAIDEEMLKKTGLKLDIVLITFVLQMGLI